jgi:hypothetical protein
MRTPVICAVALGLWSTVATGQTTVPDTLSPALRGHVQREQFGIVTSIRGLPLGVREALQKLFATPSLDIAEPGAEFQATDVIANPRLPIRRLISAGCSIDHCLVYYERGGFAHERYALLFRWTPAETRVEWGGSAPGGLTAIGGVRDAILAGQMKGPVKSW